MRKILRFLGLMLLLAGAVLVAREVNAQVKKSAPAANSPATSEVQAFVAREFGDSFKIATDIEPIVGDFDGDGREDIVVVATGDNPLMGEARYNYKTSDPYNASFGFGDPKVTMAYNASESVPRYLLVAHDWRANNPKKFVLVNIPFKSLRIGHMMLKKKVVSAVESIDIAGVQGAIYWTGKKYKWEVIGAEADTRNN